VRHTILFSKLGSSSELPIFEIVTDFFERLLAAVSQSGYLIVPLRLGRDRSWQIEIHVKKNVINVVLRPQKV
jgi:hypothetical protein